MLFRWGTLRWAPLVALVLALMTWVDYGAYGCWVEEYEELEAESQATERQRNRKAKVDDSSSSYKAKIADVNAKKWFCNGMVTKVAREVQESFRLPHD
ncbi:hypothetical protein CDL15_Pgr009289 [Punica granatum]|uniref:Uncharacterized protein n=1 Tax=Punica granatum TaxID=22663 RepID=A0A218XGI3_PUNGR|nr:hypothetical protein CDL15_Pgr009289 [Punica granatum]PKI43513.1 hypothetical protein CRG98_036115 [Punica granatum]